jgi:hypothetical protein
MNGSHALRIWGESPLSEALSPHTQNKAQPATVGTIRIREVEVQEIVILEADESDNRSCR